MACLQHLSRYVVDPTAQTLDWNDDLIKETYRFFEQDIGVAPAHTLFGGYYGQSDFFYDYVNILFRAEMLTLGEHISVTELAECYRKHLGVFDFQHLYDELQVGDTIGEYDAKKQTLALNPEHLAKSKRRLEKFYGTLLRN